MDYVEFKQSLISELNDFYGNDAEIKEVVVPKCNGESYEGVQVFFAKIKYNPEAVPVINIDNLFSAYCRGELTDINDCVEMIYRISEGSGYCEDVSKLVTNIQNWEYVKEIVYPSLLQTEMNSMLLENLVSFPILDLSIVFIIRGEFRYSGNGMVKVTQALLDCYGITCEELYEQAVKNLEQDGYIFQDMKIFLQRMVPGLIAEEEEGGFVPHREMYIFTNAAKCYGAAGILSCKLLRKFAGKRSFYILPSSIHETIFIPAAGVTDKEMLDDMVRQVNSTMSDRTEYLSDHSYYYDGELGEIRMSE